MEDAVSVTEQKAELTGLKNEWKTVQRASWKGSISESREVFEKVWGSRESKRVETAKQCGPSR